MPDSPETFPGPSGSGEEALVVFDETRHVCLLSNYSMPKMGGAEVIYLLRQRCPTLPMVGMTGAGVKAEEDLLAAGALEVVKKPFTIGQIQEAVKRALKRKRQP